MKVFHVIDSLERTDGGPPKSCLDLVKALENYDCELSVVYRRKMNDPYENARELNTLNVPFWKIFSVLRKNKPDILHFHGLWLPYLFIWFVVGKLLKVKILISIRGMLEDWSLQQSAVKKRIVFFLYQKYMLTNAQLLHATSEEEKISIRKQVKRTDSIIIPNSIIISNYIRRNKYKKTGTIGFISRIHKKKGLEYLIKSLLTNSYQLKIAGTGDPVYIKELKGIVTRLNLVERVEFLGFLDGRDKQELIESCEVVVLPTYSENFGVIVAESMALEVPVITTYGTPWGYLNQEHLGFCIELNQNNLNNALSKIEAMNENDLVKMGKRARAKIVSDYDIEKVAGKFHEVYAAI